MKLAKVKFGKALKTVWPKSVNFCMRRMPTWKMDLGLLKLMLLCCTDFTAMPFVPTHLEGKGMERGVPAQGCRALEESLPTEPWSVFG